MRQLLAVLISLFPIISCDAKENVVDAKFTNEISESRMLLVLSAPSVNDSYYTKTFELIVKFQIDYAKKIIGNDNIVIIVDKDTKKYYQNNLPKDILITADVHDIWIRDFTTVNPISPTRFKYTSASMTKEESIEVQNSFKTFASEYNIQMTATDLLLDGGNWVDNYDGKGVTTTKFLKDNNLTYEEGKKKLMALLNVAEVAIIEPEEVILAHSDGMVSWINENMLLVNDYSSNSTFRDAIMDELKLSFPTTTIIEVPVKYRTNLPSQWIGFESACGVNLNSTVTFNTIYVPVFGRSHDQQVIDIIQKNTSKNVINVNAEGVCDMGGSVRCLTWQLTGENAEKLIIAARENDIM